MFRQVFSAFCVLAFWLTAPAASAQTKWPTTDFQLEQSSWRTIAGGIDLGERVAMEEHLKETAKHYEAMGFRAPDLEMSADNTRYIVRLDHAAYDLKETAAVTTRFENAPEYISLRIKRMPSILSSSGRLNGEVAYYISHELFHAVQRAYPGMKSEEAGHWVLEGTAEAISYDLMVDWNYLPNSDCAGVRDINRTPLGFRGERTAAKNAQCTANISYGTSGFWRYLGQARANKNQLTGHSKLKANYAYLVDFFNFLDGSPLEGNVTKEYRNVDGFLMKAKLGDNLRVVYTSWAATSASYPNTNKRKKAAMLKEFFGTCHEVHLPKDNPFIRLDQIKLKHYTASCILIFADEMTGPLDVFVDVTGDRVDDLLMGIEGGLIVSMPKVPKDASATKFGNWIFPVKEEERKNGVAFILASAPSKNLDNESRIYEAMISVNSVTSSATSPTTTKPATKQPTKKQSSVRAKEHSKAVSAARTLAPNYHTSQSAFVWQGQKTRNCREPYRFMVCGPSMTIGLSAMPNSAPDLSIMRASGGGSAQVKQSLLAMHDFPAKNWVSSAIEANREPGRRVDITFPYIEFGETGSFSNAQIITGNGKDRGSLKAVTANDMIIGKGIGFELNGSVTIDHYSKHSMSGSYSGTMVDDQDVPPGDDPMLPVVTKISGSFHIASPWRGDPNFEMIPLDWKIIMDERARDQRNGGNSESSGRNGGKSSGGNSSSSSGNGPIKSNCKCRCEYQRQTKNDSACVAKCTPVWNIQCPLPIAK